MDRKAKAGPGENQVKAWTIIATGLRDAVNRLISLKDHQKDPRFISLQANEYV